MNGFDGKEGPNKGIKRIPTVAGGGANLVHKSRSKMDSIKNIYSNKSLHGDVRDNYGQTTQMQAQMAVKTGKLHNQMMASRNS